MENSKPDQTSNSSSSPPRPPIPKKSYLRKSWAPSTANTAPPYAQVFPNDNSCNRQRAQKTKQIRSKSLRNYSKRPEITIVSSEPMNTHPAFADGCKGSRIPPEAPPSYDDVIKQQTSASIDLGCSSSADVFFHHLTYHDIEINSVTSSPSSSTLPVATENLKMNQSQIEEDSKPPGKPPRRHSRTTDVINESIKLPNSKPTDDVIYARVDKKSMRRTTKPTARPPPPPPRPKTFSKIESPKHLDKDEMSKKTPPVTTTPVATTPVATTSVATTPVATTPVATTSVATTPVATTPVATTPVATTPVDTTPVDTTPVDTTPVATTPVATTPVATTPVATTPVDTTPVATTSVATTPVATTPVATTPVATTPVATTPVATTPVATTPVDTTPVDTTPVATTPVDTTPVDTTPVATTPVVMTPVPMPRRMSSAKSSKSLRVPPQPSTAFQTSASNPNTSSPNAIVVNNITASSQPKPDFEDFKLSRNKPKKSKSSRWAGVMLKSKKKIPPSKTPQFIPQKPLRGPHSLPKSPPKPHVLLKTPPKPPSPQTRPKQPPARPPPPKISATNSVGLIRKKSTNQLREKIVDTKMKDYIANQRYYIARSSHSGFSDLNFSSGDRIFILYQINDQLAFGRSEEGEEGAFPLDCVFLEDQDQQIDVTPSLEASRQDAKTSGSRDNEDLDNLKGNFHITVDEDKTRHSTNSKLASSSPNFSKITNQ